MFTITVGVKCLLLWLRGTGSSVSFTYRLGPKYGSFTRDLRSTNGQRVRRNPEGWRGPSNRGSSTIVDKSNRSVDGETFIDEHVSDVVRNNGGLLMFTQCKY